MNTKNFNIFERHVEKIALAVAAAGAAYMVVLAFQPLTIDAGGHPVEVVKVEDEVTAAVQKLEAAKAATLQKGVIKPRIPEYALQYKKSMEEQPLAPALVNSAAIPTFVPHQAPVVPMNVNGPKIGELVLTPSVSPPTDLIAASWRGTVMKNVSAGPAPATGTPAPAPLAPGVAPPAGEDKDLVGIFGNLPIASFAKFMDDVNPIEQRLPGPFRKTIVYHVDAQRRPRIGNTWGEWKDVPPQSLVVVQVGAEPPQPIPTLDDSVKDPAVLDATLSALKDSLGKIVQPESYVTLDGKPVLDLLKGAATPVTSKVPPAGAAVTPAPTPPASGVVPPAAPAPTANLSGVSDLPFWIVDDSVSPGTEYQYRVRLAMVNPTFCYPGKLIEPSKKNQALLLSQWAIVPNTVEVQGNMYFYVTGGGGQPPKINVQIFKWTNGNWFVDNSATGEPGRALAGSVKIDRTSPAVPVPTDHTVVDVLAVGNDVEAVLLDAKGNLVTKNSSVDSHDPKRDVLNKLVVHPERAPATTRPGTGTGTGTGTKPPPGGTHPPTGHPEGKGGVEGPGGPM